MFLGSGKEIFMDEQFRVIDGVLHELIGKCDPSKCDAWCCRHLHFVVPKMSPDSAEYFRLHGCEVVESGNELHVLVEKDCPHLDTQHLTCKIYDTRPSACQKYASREGDVFKSEYCGLHWKPIHGRRAQVIMSRMRKGDI